MFRQYLIQALNLMKQNRFFSFVYILGTALAISMVMMMAIVYYIRTADIPPEVNRGRLCLLDAATSVSKDGQSNWTGNLSFKTVREVYYPLRTPELVSAYISPGVFTYNVGEMLLRIPGGRDKFEIKLSATDAAYWQMFRFTFIDGKPYTPADFESGLRRIVLSETMARQLFGKADVAGQGVLLNLFLGVIGTFWFRIEYRREELGLRMALGASRRKIQQWLLWESVCLFAIAFVPALLVCLNIYRMDLLATENMDLTAGRFLFDTALSLLLLLLVILLATWYPARRSARIEPAEALHYE